MLEKKFYKSFEEKYRGSRELITQRLKIYLPFVEPLIKIYQERNIFDIGCGRGEWLELMRSNGFSEFGMDLNLHMVSDCTQYNLHVEKGDAINHLVNLPDESQVVISAFHVVEHIPFEQLHMLVSEAHRVLLPGGLLLLETPNPENIMVATTNFYLDPTHDRPLPPELLAFMPEYYGYYRTKILRLQESEELKNRENVSVREIFEGVSPDYSVVAQKIGPMKILRNFDVPFNQDFGLTLSTLAQRYDLKNDKKFQHIESLVADASETIHEFFQKVSAVEKRIDISEEKLTLAKQRASQAEAQANQAEDRASQAEARASQAEDRASQAEARATQAEDRAFHAEARANQAEDRARFADANATQSANQLASVYSSWSWRITTSCRWLEARTRNFRYLLRGARPKRELKKKICKREKKTSDNQETNFSSISNRTDTAPQAPFFIDPQKLLDNDKQIMQTLSPKAKEIYYDLKNAIESNLKEKS